MKFVVARSHLLLLISALTLSTVSAQSPLTGPTPGVLALRNGQVISGNILRDGDRYLVTLGESAEIRIRVDSVEFHGQDLQQLYQFKRSALVPTDTDGQLDLAEWSLRHGLLARAEQLLSLRPQQARSRSRWTDLQRRLDLAKRPVARPVARPVVPLSPAPLPDTRPQMDQLLKGISGLNMHEFAGFVQPLLLNTCSTATCHGAQSKSTFKLISPPRGRAIPTRYTRRNFYSTWQTLTPQHPDQSPLINITTAPHGGAPAIFTQRKWDQYQRLVNWARSTSRTTGSPAPREIASPATILSQPRRMPRAGTDPRGLVATPVTPTTPLGTRQSTAQPENEVRNPKLLPHSVDPFDPNLFNRQFHADRFNPTPKVPAEEQKVIPPAETGPPDPTLPPGPVTPR
jgi:hypothetical protein